ncbi:hypothetical protein CPB84DRAFT_1778686 [Gymnopilus junonius]|uniref:Uncharacterized protein n=1 Tax=Gymnopilus junonius TaxID=109634 RepID=A0A9P5NMV8_GYMJU|nr:hypothetical protein CPB84DRAFT_1778686 [Gymnopilus junonius]
MNNCVWFSIVVYHANLLSTLFQALLDPTYLDSGYSIVSGTNLTIELPSKCYSGPNEHLKPIGRGICSAITTMATLAVLIMIVAPIVIVAARCAIELSKMPPPVFPTGAQAPVMRWLDRKDPFLTVSERRPQYMV